MKLQLALDEMNLVDALRFACPWPPSAAIPVMLLLLRLVPLIPKTAFRFPMHIWGLKAPW